ncbi:sperm-associated antigen 17-like isoform X2 [Babylonia areolata]|uniref:sperm-associated antigen 17-like isoform X2 n=1 Tax=Babylonia areolata TaxID=304850 RepID=UPI003FD3B9B0
MSKAGKRAKSGTGPVGAGKWEQALSTANFEEDNWKPNVSLIVGNRVDDYKHIDILSAVVATGVRRLFSVVTKENLYQEARELGNPKNKKQKDVPANFEVCEPVKTHLDADEEVPLPLLAKLIKFHLLSVKTADIKRREAEKKAALEKEKAKKDKAAGKDARAKSPGKKGGKKTPEPQSAKEGSKLKKRGEDDQENKFIDDEPDDGAQHYILLVGFNNPHLPFYLAEVGININAIIRLSSQDYSRFAASTSDTVPKEDKDEKALAEEAAREERYKQAKELNTFWCDIVTLLRSNPDTSKLHDIARLDYQVKSLLLPSSNEDPEQKTQFGTAMFEDVACMIYDLQDARRLYQTYLNNLKLITVPTSGDKAADKGATDGQSTGAPPTPAIPVPPTSSASAHVEMSAEFSGPPDMRFYNDLMNTVPQESVSVFSMMNCMLEQVVATEENREPPSEQPAANRNDGLSSHVADHLSSVAFRLALSEEEHKVLSSVLELPQRPPEEPKPPLLMNMHDDICIRSHHLNPTHSFNPEQVECEMLKLLPLADKCRTSRPTSAVARARAARLQELIHFCATNGLSPSEIDRAFKLFVFESMDLSTTDPNGFILTWEGEGLGHSSIPWDDPYPFFKGMIPHEEKTCKLEMVESPSDERSDSELSRLSSPSPPLGTDHMTYRPSRSSRHSGQSDASKPVAPREGERPAKNRRGKKRAKSPAPDDQLSQALDTDRSNKVGGEEAGGRGSRPSSRTSSTDSKKGILRSRPSSESPRRSRSNSCVHFEVPADHKLDAEVAADAVLQPGEENGEKTLEDSMMEVVEAQKRVLDQWCFAEHYEPHVLLQVLKDACYILPFMETYEHKRDQSVMLVLHNPYNTELQNHVDWHTELHSNVGFRNYLEYVAESIADWLKEKEAEYQAHLLSTEVEKMRQDDESDSKTGDKKGKKSPRKSDKAEGGKKARSKSPKGSRSSSVESVGNTNPYVRPNSLKAWKEEQERIKAEEDEKESLKKEKRARSAQKKEKEEKEEKKPGSRSSSKSKLSQRAPDEPPADDQPPPIKEEEEPYWPFTGYDTGNQLLHASGITTTLFPSDGGQIRTERTEFVQGTTAVRTAVLKDGHVFAVHVLNPREGEEEPQDPDLEPVSSSTLSDELEKSETEKSEKEEKEGGEQAEKEKKAPPVSQFGSLTATLIDGMVLSLSQWGATGETAEGKPYEPAPYVPPAPSPSPQPQAASPTKGKKERGKVSNTPEPASVQEEELPVEEKVEEKKVPEQPFQEVFVTCPDGLQVRYFLQSSVGVVPMTEEDRHLVVKQSYPFKTSGMQDCEAARRQYIVNEQSRVMTADGTVVKHMTDGSVEVLYADGTVGVHTGHWPTPPSRASSPPRPSSAHSQAGDRVETPTKKGGRSAGKGGGRSHHAAEKAAAAPDPNQTIPEWPEEEKKGTWTVTYPNGERYRTSTPAGTSSSSGANPPAVETLKPVMICVASDPDTKQTMATRDDHVITVSYPDGTTVVEHGDGTRITVYYRDTQVPIGEGSTANGEPVDVITETLKFVKIECPAYATVEFNCATSENLTVFGSGTSINVFPDGYYILHHARGGRIEVDTEGTMVYYPRPNKNMEQLLRERDLQYLLRHNADIICETVDPDGNIFNVRSSGDFCVMPANGGDELSDNSDDPLNTGEKKLVRYGQHAPRFFIIHADGSGTELLRYQDIAEYLTSAERNPATAVLKEPLPEYPGVVGLTILKPYIGGLSERWLKAYDQASIVPNGIRSRDLSSLPSKEAKRPGPKFGTNVGQGLSVGGAIKTQARIPILKCPSALELRQFVQYKPVSEDLRQRLQQGLRGYAEYVMERARLEDLMMVDDPRSEDEKILASDLLSTAMSQRPEPVDPDHIKDTYETAIAPPPPSPPATPQPKRTQADWERDQRELAEEAEGLEMLRGKKVPTYFESEMGKAFLLTQAKNMEEMLRELSEDPRRDGTEAVRADTSNMVSTRDIVDPSPASTMPRPIHSRPGMSQMSDRSAAESDSPATVVRTKLLPETPLSFMGGTMSELNAGTPSGIRPGNPTPAHATGQGSPAPLRPKNPTPAKASKVVTDRPVNPTPKMAGGYAETPSEFEIYTRGEYPMILEQPMEEERGVEFYETDTDMLVTPSLKKNVAGDPRTIPVPLPNSIQGGRPNAVPNDRYQQVEEPVRRHVKNTGSLGVTPQGAGQLRQLQGLSVFPEEVNFGVLREGSTYAFLLQLKNTGVDSCRFKVRQPPPATGLRVIYKPGPVAAGMKVDLRLELYAIAVGVEGESGVGTVSHCLEIVTQTDILRVPVQATVMTCNESEMDGSGGGSPTVSHAPGVVLLSNRPPASTGIIRPRRDIVVGGSSR